MSEVEELAEAAVAEEVPAAQGAPAAPGPEAAVAYQTGDEILVADADAEGEFVHLAVHSEYSIEDGLAKVPALVARAAELGMPAVALTDSGNLFGLVKFYAACRQAGIKAVIGVDLEYEDEDGSYLCRLLVANETGYRNLLRLVSAAYTSVEGCASGGHGRVRREAVLAAAAGLVALLGRESDPGAAPAGEAAVRRLEPWRQAFGDRAYLEVVRTGRAGEGQFVHDAAELAAATGVPLVATNDVRFLAAEDFEAHETRVCIQQGRVLNDPRRERPHSDQQYLRSPAEMRALFADLPEALDNSVEVAKRCSYAMQLGTYYLPAYPVPPGQTLADVLRQRAEAGLEAHLARDGAAPGVPAERYGERLAYELGVITQMGFAGYFLIVQEFVNWAREHAVPVGCRGSGTASLVAYCLGITDLDPLGYDLLFERLLNPERVSMPDFDIDFCMEGRERVIAHVAELYGQEAVSQIVTFGTMAARLVVRDVARVQGKPFGLGDRLSKMVPFEVGMTLAKAVEQVPELREFIGRNEDAAELMEMAYKLEGVVRNTGRHAGGVVIAPRALTDFVPLYADQAGGGALTQFDLHDVEEAGLVKFDFLGLKTLTIIDWAVAAINAEREAAGEAPVDVKRLPLDDGRTYALLKTGKTTAVFQLESQGMKELIARLQPDSIDDLIALVALFRPGPLQSGAVEDYIARKHGRAQVAYPHPALEAPLKSTYGVMLYQEQVMNMAQRLAGFSLGQADLLRRAMAKKKPEEMVTMRAMFLEGTDGEGVDRRIASSIFDQVEKFAGYAFPKAHAASYAMLSFQTGWLKAHYPAQFMAAVLSADMQNIDKVVALVDEVRRLGITLRPPDVQESAFRFQAQNGAIRYGLGAVRGVGEGPVAALVAAREANGPFADLADFCRRVDARRANKRVLEALINAGGMDSLATASSIDAARAELLAGLPDAVQGAEQVAKSAEMGLEDMFGGVAEPASAPRPATKPLTPKERLEGEKEALGLYFSGHPIERYLEEIRGFCRTSIDNLRPAPDLQLAAGFVISNRTLRRDRGDMAFARLDDRSGRIEVCLYGDVFAQNRAKLEPDTILVVEGKVEADDREDGKRLRAERVMTLAEARTRFRGAVVIDGTRCAANGSFAARLRQVLSRHQQPGGCPVHVDCATPGARGRVTLGEAWQVEASDALLGQLREAFGEQAVALNYAGAGA